MSEGVGIPHAIKISMQKSYTKDKVVSDDYLPYKLQGHLQGCAWGWHWGMGQG